eukprot:GHVL01010821.1.p1 GENE.GHVL01010821.1~~GHVL01010821.1.p1  ORF type:complete len:471 (+),score=94.11 GHVL01010821.1:21-1433(+)
MTINQMNTHCFRRVHHSASSPNLCSTKQKCIKRSSSCGSHRMNEYVINVGGKHFTLSKHCVEAIRLLSERNFFESLLTPRDDIGNVFVDRDTSLFELILEYINKGELPKTYPGTLKREFDYFKIPWPSQCTRCGVLFDRHRSSVVSRCSFHVFSTQTMIDDKNENVAYRCCGKPLGSNGCVLSSHTSEYIREVRNRPPKCYISQEEYIKSPKKQELLTRAAACISTTCRNDDTVFSKIKMCLFYQQGQCRRGDQCQFAHSAAELRVAPNLKKTKLCMTFQMGLCKDSTCHFAHSLAELRSTGDFFKTGVCYFWKNGFCKAGDFCRHAHGETELRHPVYDENIKKKIISYINTQKNDISYINTQKNDISYINTQKNNISNENLKKNNISNENLKKNNPLTEKNEFLIEKNDSLIEKNNTILIENLINFFSVYTTILKKNENILNRSGCSTTSTTPSPQNRKYQVENELYTE